MEKAHKLRVNTRDHTVVVDDDTPLLYVLRNDLALNGPKFGCGLAQCGACAVLMDGHENSILHHSHRRGGGHRDHH